MTGRPHLLYTAWSYPPSRAGGVYRALATVNAFARDGWDVTVLTVPREVFLSSTGIDEALERQVAKSVRIVRVPVEVPAYQNDLARWSGSRARWPEFWRLADLRRDLPLFPEPNYGRWRPALEAAADEVHREHPVDVAMGTANPHVDFIPGWRLASTSRVPYVMDYRDAWQLDVFSGEKLISAIPAVDRWERRLVRGASEVWFVNEPILDWHAARMPQDAGKMRVVANGFDTYDVSLQVPVRPDRHESLVFGYVGTISDKVPLAALIQGWRTARARGGAMAEARLVLRGYLGHFGGAASGMEALLREAAEYGVSYEGPVGKSAIAETYRTFDVLVLALGAGRYVTSGKVYEYAATGIPIISVHPPTNAAAGVLRDAPSWVQAGSVDPDAIADALVRVARMSVDETSQRRAAAQDWGAQYERARQLGPRIEALRELADTSS